MRFHIGSNIGYLAALAIASGVILVLGFALRPKDAPAPAISEAERAQLQNLAQRQALQRRSVMLAGYARELSNRATQILSDPAAFRAREPRSGEMLIVVTAVDGGNPHWITAEFAGYEPVKCAGQSVSGIGVDAVIPGSLERSAVFTLDEDFVGLVVRCDDRLIIVNPQNYGLFRGLAAEQRYMTCCGVRFSHESGGETGLLIRELQIGSVLDLAGVEPGDRLLKINGQPITSDDLLRRVIAAPELSIDVERSGRTLTLRYRSESPAAGVTLQRSPQGARVIRVLPGSLPERLGLNAGDVILRAGDVRRPAPAIVEKLLASADTVRIVVSRDDRELLLEATR